VGAAGVVSHRAVCLCRFGCALAGSWHIVFRSQQRLNSMGFALFIPPPPTHPHLRFVSTETLPMDMSLSSSSAMATQRRLLRLGTLGKCYLVVSSEQLSSERGGVAPRPHKVPTAFPASGFAGQRHAGAYVNELRRELGGAGRRAHAK
jgi:hypothetical protein